MCTSVEVTRVGLELSCLDCDGLGLLVRKGRPCPRCGAERWALSFQSDPWRERAIPCPCKARAHPNYAADDAALKRILANGTWLPVRSRGRVAVPRGPKTNWDSLDYAAAITRGRGGRRGNKAVDRGPKQQRRRP